jgi:hypothetical protein
LNTNSKKFYAHVTFADTPRRALGTLFRGIALIGVEPDTDVEGCCVVMRM